MIAGKIISLVKSTPSKGDGRAGGGFGFVRDEETGVERFFHARDVVLPATFDTLQEQQAVQYEGTFDQARRDAGKGNGQQAKKVQAC